MIVKQDTKAKSLQTDPVTSIVRVDGITLCKRVVRDGVVWLQFKDKDRMRSDARGTPFVEVPLVAFGAMLMAAVIEDALIWPY
jgi:hypothetical protein